MRLYRCDRCKKEMKEDDIYKIYEFRKRELNIEDDVRYDFCSACAKEWDALMITVSDAFLKHQTIEVIKEGKTYFDNCDMNLFDPEKEKSDDNTTTGKRE